MAYLRKTDIAFQDTASLDAFGRLRVSEVSTELDIKYLVDDQPLLVDEVTNGTGASTYSATNSLVNMSTAASGDYCVRQTFARAHYQSGKSQQIFMTGSNFHTQTNIEKKIGYFSDVATVTTPDGLYLENDGTEVSINIRRIGNNTETTAQSSWNQDTLDGNGPSGITVDWEKNFILFIDFEWLGVGRVRWCLVLDGAIIPFHYSNHTNMTLETPYMQSPNQPLRWSIRQTGAGSGTFDTICATVGSEGAFNQTGKVLSDNMGTTHVDANSSSNVYALIGIKLQAGKQDQVVDILDFSVISETSDDQLVQVFLNPTVAGTFTYANVTNSSVQTAKAAGSGETVTGGTLIFSQYVTQQTATTFQIDQAIRLGLDIAASTLDEIVLCTTPLSSNSDVLGAINWRERV